MKRYFAIVLGVLFLTAAAFAGDPDCKPQMALGQTWDQIKLACPDIDPQYVEIDREANLTTYFCPSQSAVVIGNRSSKLVVALMRVDFDPRVTK